MVSGLRIEHTLEGVLEILTHPEIYPNISDDLSPPVEDFSLDMLNGHEYLVGFVDKPIGYVGLHPANGITLIAHIQILPEYRKEYALEFGKGAAQWIWDNTQFMKIQASIPTLYPNVISFIERLGFNKEGVSEKSYLRHGEIHDSVYFGMARP